MKEITSMDISDNRKESSAKSFSTSKNCPISFMMLSSFALMLDISVILLILQWRKLRRRPANKFLMNLVISDGIVYISFISYTGNLWAVWDDEKTFYENYFTLHIFDVFFYVAVVLSMLNFTLITVDRLIAVKWPFFYVKSFHTKQSLIAIAIVWGVTIAYAIVMVILFLVLDPEISQYLGNVTFATVVIAGFVILFISNSFVFVEARCQLRSIDKLFHSIKKISAESSGKSSNKERDHRKKEFRMVRIIIGLILCFFLFLINVLILTIMKVVYVDENEPPISLKYILASWYLVLIYYICNPLCYVALSCDVKREVKQLFRGKRLEES